MTPKRVIIKAAIVLALILVYQGYNSLVDIFRWIERNKSGLSTKSVQVGNHKIVYLEGGVGDAVVLLHGFGDSKDAWVKFSRELVKTNRVVIPDIPGFGESTKDYNSKYDIGTQVARIHEFAKAIGLKKFHIAGNSMGGLISGIYAADYPGEVLSLGLFDAAGIVNREKSEIQVLFEKGVNPLVVENSLDFDRLMSLMFYKVPDMPGVVRKELAARSVESREFNKKIIADGIPFDMLEKRLKDIKVKTIVVWGDTDRIFPSSSAKVLGEKLKGSKVFIIRESGHLPMTEKPEESSKYYMEFIK